MEQMQLNFNIIMNMNRQKTRNLERNFPYKIKVDLIIKELHLVSMNGKLKAYCDKINIKFICSPFHYPVKN